MFCHGVTCLSRRGRIATSRRIPSPPCEGPDSRNDEQFRPLGNLAEYSSGVISREYWYFSCCRCWNIWSSEKDWGGNIPIDHSQPFGLDISGSTSSVDAAAVRDPGNLTLGVSLSIDGVWGLFDSESWISFSSSYCCCVSCSSTQYFGRLVDRKTARALATQSSVLVFVSRSKDDGNGGNIPEGRRDPRCQRGRLRLRVLPFLLVLVLLVPLLLERSSRV